MLCVIQKAFNGPGDRLYSVGELVDASDWRLRDKLIEGRYMRPATEREVASAEEVDVPEAPARKPRRKSR
jgi:hypothetical protein